MGPYKPFTFEGDGYTRARQIVADNPLNGVPSVTFREQKVFDVAGGESIAQETGEFRVEMLPESVATTFPLLDVNGDPTGGTATFADVYATLYSLYVFLADQRDANSS